MSLASDTVYLRIARSGKNLFVLLLSDGKAWP